MWHPDSDAFERLNVADASGRSHAPGAETHAIPKQPARLAALHPRAAHVIEMFVRGISRAHLPTLLVSVPRSLG